MKQPKVVSSKTTDDHDLKNSDFCKLVSCECTKDCTKHWSFQQPKHPPITEPTSTNNTHFENNIPKDIPTTTTKLPNKSIKSLKNIQILKGQNDIGANASVTNNKDSILLYQAITPYSIGGVQKDDPAITCTGKGYVVWKSRGGDNLLVPIFYCAEADGTIISPNSVQSYYKSTYKGFHMFCDCDAKSGHLKFYHRDGISHAIFDAYSENNLWYHDMTNNPHSPPSPSVEYVYPTIHRLNKAAKYELWHQRMIHPGTRCMCMLHKHVDGIDEPLNGNTFYRCAACMQGKPRKNARGPPTHVKHKRKRTRTKKHKPQPEPQENTSDDTLDDIFLPNALPGQHFHMDFGFVRGSTYTLKQENGPTITSKDGYNSYLIIVDRATRYMWVFLTKSKHPPVHVARKVLRKFKATNPHRTVRTDQGKELGKSEAFRTMIGDEGFNLELTGAEASSQNGIAEAPNRVLAQMMRCTLYSADLGPEYWSYALRLSVYVKNRLPHTSINTTPFQALTGQRPDVSKMRIFGSRVCARIPGADKFPKLDHKKHKWDLPWVYSN